MGRPTLILHAGAGRNPAAAWAEGTREKLRTVAAAAHAVLLRSGALDAVTEAVRLLEDDPRFNAGTGSRLQADGEARLSASLMDGRSGRFSAVVNVTGVPNPVLVARALQREEYRVLAGEGARRFAERAGVRLGDPRTPEAVAEWKKGASDGSDTVGACAVDASGALAAATSTGGRGGETPGRVSDSGTPAADYADARCAVSATGVGEEILEAGLAVRIATRAADGLPLSAAFDRAFDEVRRAGGRMGAIGVDAAGTVSWAMTTPALLFAWTDGERGGTF